MFVALKKTFEHIINIKYQYATSNYEDDEFPLI